MNPRSRSIAAPTAAPWTMSCAAQECSTRSWTSVSIRAEPVAPRISSSSRGRSPGALAPGAVEHVLADVAERWVAEVVAEPDRLREVLVETQRAGDRARDLRGLERVRQPRAVVIALGRDEHLRLVLEPAERLAVDDPVAVALERRAQPAVLLRPRAVGRVRARGGGRQRRLLPG